MPRTGNEASGRCGARLEEDTSAVGTGVSGGSENGGTPPPASSCDQGREIRAPRTQEKRGVRGAEQGTPHTEDQGTPHTEPQAMAQGISVRGMGNNHAQPLVVRRAEVPPPHLCQRTVHAVESPALADKEAVLETDVFVRSAVRAWHQESNHGAVLIHDMPLRIHRPHPRLGQQAVEHLLPRPSTNVRGANGQYEQRVQLL